MKLTRFKVNSLALLALCVLFAGHAYASYDLSSFASSTYDGNGYNAIIYNSDGVSNFTAYLFVRNGDTLTPTVDSVCLPNNINNVGFTYANCSSGTGAGQLNDWEKVSDLGYIGSGDDSGNGNPAVHYGAAYGPATASSNYTDHRWYTCTDATYTNCSAATGFLANNANAWGVATADLCTFPGPFSAPYGIADFYGPCGTAPPPVKCSSGDTRICDFTPEDGATTTSPVTFTLKAYISPNDVGNGYDVKLTLHNIDQNVLLLGALSPSDIFLIGTRIGGGQSTTTGGVFNFSTTTFIGDGNYRLNAVMEQDLLDGFLKNPFGPSSNQSHQFVVGQPTFIGNISQNLFNDIFGANGSASSSATSTTALLAGCNLLGNFNIVNCMSGLFVPDAAQTQDLIDNFKQGVATHVPWGYVTRLYAIMTSTTTTALPTFTASVPVSRGDQTLQYTTLTFDPGEMLAAGAEDLNSVQDPINHQTAHDVFYPMVAGSVALMVILTIAADVMGSHRHHTE